MSTPRFNPNKNAPVGAFMSATKSESVSDSENKSGTTPVTESASVSTSKSEDASAIIPISESTPTSKNEYASASASEYASDPSKAEKKANKNESTGINASASGHASSVNSSASVSGGLADHLAKAKEPKFEDLYAKTNVWIQKDLLAIVDAVTKQAKPGLKKTIFNEALKMYLKANGLLK
ncbi:hypothetical protein EV210_12337 [Anaerospora hongkongensis]|uniref:Uncharacterized protein n=1 Tax=Anaerospora hongkongensis TaxID=244830 RepID=A0A4R1PWS7_9FIRM|nr:hypothetical protein [Anaerospora hongkongensis]TCL32217.1 hypothetical protein EV210_12337 [Anaerospora hongkongensis]